MQGESWRDEASREECRRLAFCFVSSVINKKSLAGREKLADAAKVNSPRLWTHSLHGLAGVSGVCEGRLADEVSSALLPIYSLACVQPVVFVP